MDGCTTRPERAATCPPGPSARPLSRPRPCPSDMCGRQSSLAARGLSIDEPQPRERARRGSAKELQLIPFRFGHGHDATGRAGLGKDAEHDGCLRVSMPLDDAPLFTFVTDMPAEQILELHVASVHEGEKPTRCAGGAAASRRLSSLAIASRDCVVRNMRMTDPARVLAPLLKRSEPVHSSAQVVVHERRQHERPDEAHQRREAEGAGCFPDALGPGNPQVVTPFRPRASRAPRGPRSGACHAAGRNSLLGAVAEAGSTDSSVSKPSFCRPAALNPLTTR